jgi:hypothetical protein
VTQAPQEKYKATQVIASCPVTLDLLSGQKQGISALEGHGGMNSEYFASLLIVS